MQIVRICSISVTVCVPFFGYISTRSWKTVITFDVQSRTFTHLGCETLNGKGFIAQRIPLVLGDIFGGRISESAACGRDSLPEGLNGVKAEKNRLER